MKESMSRRSFVAGAALAAGSAVALAGCASSSGSASKSGSASASASSASASASAASASASASSAAAAGKFPRIELKKDKEVINGIISGTDMKVCCIILSVKRGYYEAEGIDYKSQTMSGGFNGVMPKISSGEVDVIPFGSIPGLTYIGQGDDLVIFGGTVANGSEAVTRVADKDAFKKADDFKGKKVACYRMETGHMATKSWLRQQGLKIGDNLEDLAAGKCDVAFIYVEETATAMGAMEKGEYDIVFTNSGGGYQYTANNENLTVAFQPQDIIGHEFPCCRQTTNRKNYEEKKSAFVKYEMANIRAMWDIEHDRENVIKDLVEFSGQPEEYVVAVMYGNDNYRAAMTYEMDPYTDDVKTFWGDMIDNGDITEITDKEHIVKHLDSSIYWNALTNLIERSTGDEKAFYENLMKVYEKHNTLGV